VSQLTPKPPDQEEPRGIRLAVDAVAVAETGLLHQIAVAVNGHLAMDSLQAAYHWLRTFITLHSNQPQHSVRSRIMCLTLPALSLYCYRIVASLSLYCLGVIECVRAVSRDFIICA